MQTPILFIVYNRPDVTRASLEAIKSVYPTELYIAADGPAENKPEDKKKCQEVRRVIEEIVDWPCHVHTHYRQKNYGCRKGVSEAITWFFTKVTEGIILEDDCLPEPTFFRYCHELLERYRTDTRILTISGYTPTPKVSYTKASYYFTRYPQVWGWATWRRTWQQYDSTISDWGKNRETEWLSERVHNKLVAEYLHHAFNQVYEEGFDTWDYQLAYLHLKLGGMSIIPTVNLIENIGFGKEATHTTARQGRVKSRVPRTYFPLRHPTRIGINHKAEALFHQPVYDTPLRYFSLFAKMFRRKYLW